MQRADLVKESELFFRQWLRSPRSVGSIKPSSRALARAVAEAVLWQPGRWVVELGGGTGAITQGLIERGIPRDRLVVVELDPELAGYLRRRVPGCLVVEGDATRLDAILAELGVSDVSTVVSGLPMVRMPFAFQRAIVEQGFKALREPGTMLQYSYSPVPPVPARRLGIRAELVRYVLRNLPPATVWRYRRATT
ncbi:MAG: phospholipid methyltransferase [Geminicoccaceae bacterium]|nr:phospholipid methyltransferase [Geminicoccaceae bacterium]MCS7266674.1 phospholipid methyltransferase [Geminicoccaceae bacterium]MCX7630122.1 phospholipid methyltransferase [Geminicoccaceae bacterium]MDW8123307.1 phospholipid methyltransferase [Geminicoccaceae bacterium]MDW8340392.1 phospholipid methyltransferase [Geminicoccaceae bacterium]